jgi:hypothetical protein
MRLRSNIAALNKKAAKNPKQAQSTAPPACKHNQQSHQLAIAAALTIMEAPPAAAAAATDFLRELPEPVLLDVLQRLGPQECARGIALASNRLLQAVRQLRNGSVSLSAVDRRRLEQLVEALGAAQRRGCAPLSSLQLTGGHGRPTGQLLELPCSRLCSLQLQDVRVQLGPSLGGHAGILASLSGCLTRLELREVYCTEGLSALTSLQKQLRHLACSVLCNDDGEFVEVPPCLLATLTLTHLQLSGCNVTTASLQHLSCQSQLQELVLEPATSVTSQGFEGLRALQALTMLSVSGAVGVSFTPELLGQLPHLQRLELYVCQSFWPQALRFPQLQHLVLSGLSLAGAPSVDNVYGELLSILGQMQQLSYLSLESSLKHHAPAAPEAYAALIGPALQYLDLTFARLPADAWQHIFSTAGGRRRPALRVLKLYNVSVASAAASYAPGSAAAAAATAVTEEEEAAAEQQQQHQQLHQHHHHHAHDISGANLQNRMSLQDMQQMVTCCGKLENLVLIKVVRPGQQLCALQQLSGQLTSLHCDGMSDAAAGVLKHLTALQELHIADAGSTTDAGLLQLTALRRLTTLYCATAGASKLSSSLTARLGVVYINASKVRSCSPPSTHSGPRGLSGLPCTHVMLSLARAQSTGTSSRKHLICIHTLADKHLPPLGTHTRVTCTQAPAGAPPDVWSQLLQCCQQAQETQHQQQPDGNQVRQQRWWW